MYEQFYSKNKSIRGGGYLTKILKTNKEPLAAIIKKYEIKNGNKDFNFNYTPNKMLNNTITLRVRGYKTRNRQEVIEDLKDIHESGELQFDEVIPDLIVMKYEQYSKLQSKQNSFITKHLVVQSKSSCLPAYVLLAPLLKHLKGKRIKNLKPYVLDACAAPGNKTMQLADYLGQTFKHFQLYGNDKSLKRFNVLKQRIDQNLPPKLRKKVKCINEDFLKIDPTSEEMKQIRYILLDPSCSGTGMLTQSKLQGQFAILKKGLEDKKDFQTVIKQQYKDLQPRERKNLKNFRKMQTKLLKHASTFPNVVRIVYSTCSIYEQENEQVVMNFLESEQCKFRQFKLATALPEFKQRGFNYEGRDYSKCIRVNPIQEESDGFFVALFTKQVKAKPKNQILKS